MSEGVPDLQKGTTSSGVVSGWAKSLTHDGIYYGTSVGGPWAVSITGDGFVVGGAADGRVVSSMSHVKQTP